VWEPTMEQIYIARSPASRDLNTEVPGCVPYLANPPSPLRLSLPARQQRRRPFAQKCLDQPGKAPPRDAPFPCNDALAPQAGTCQDSIRDHINQSQPIAGFACDISGAGLWFA
jgi:hypothetical protein